jgi:hypothetical protein
LCKKRISLAAQSPFSLKGSQTARGAMMKKDRTMERKISRAIKRQRKNKKKRND